MHAKSTFELSPIVLTDAEYEFAWNLYRARRVKTTDFDDIYWSRCLLIAISSRQTPVNGSRGYRGPK